MITAKTTLKEIYRTPVGHDILEKGLYSVGIPARLLESTPLGKLSLEKLQKLTLGKVDDRFVRAMLDLLNSEKDIPAPDDGNITHKWWKEAVFYQIYPRSFKDSNGDGIGDLNGIYEKLDYLKDLGVDAIWCSPVYDSPNDDNGYDIRDYRAIMQEFGTMEDFDRLLEGIHARGMRLIMDLVINHSSDEHEWFQSALNDPDSKYKDYYIWRKGDPDMPPNNWDSIFSGPAWNYYPEKGEWAMHLFSAKQMDFNWDNPEFRRDIESMVNWWLEKGIDGFRLDVISFISKKNGLPDGNELVGTLMGFKGVEHYFYGPHLHDYLKELRRETFGKYDAFTVGECQGTGLEMSKLMTGDDRGELDVVFSFDHLENPGKQRFEDYRFDLRPMADNLAQWQTQYGSHCWPTVFFDNHDNPRMISKVDPDGAYRYEIAKALAVMQMTLKGTPFIYQGQELGMVNTVFYSIDDLRDVESLNLYKQERAKGKSTQQAFAKVCAGSRDHARTPMQWTNGKNAGFTTGEPWIGVNPDYIHCNAAEEALSHDSVLSFYRRLIALRKANAPLIYGNFVRVNAGRDYFCYRRTIGKESFYIEINLTGKQKKRPSPVEEMDLLVSNYATHSEQLRPYEANVYRVAAQ